MYTTIICIIHEGKILRLCENKILTRGILPGFPIILRSSGLGYNQNGTLLFN